MNIYKATLSLGVLMSLTGCASIFSGMSQDIRFKAIDAKTGKTLKDAEFKIVEHKGGTASVSGFDIAELDRCEGDISVTCTYTGYHPIYTKLDARLNKLYYLNFLNGMTFTWIDILTDAKFEYPKSCTVYMEKK